MSNAGFRIFVELSNFFSDYRSRARLFIDNNIETVGHLQDKIKELFSIKDFIFVCNNEYLPFTENIAILQPEETIWAVPSNCLRDENSKIKKSKLKRKVSTTEDTASCHSEKKRKKDDFVAENHTIDEELLENNINTSVEPQDFTYSTDKLKKKKKKDKKLTEDTSSCHSEKKWKKDNFVAENHTVDEELPENNVNESVEPQDFTHLSDKLKKMKKKDKKLTVPEDSDPKLEQTSLPTSFKLEQNSPKKPEYVCKGNLASYKKKIAVPMITDQYLKNKKINIIKIEVIKNGKMQPKQPDNTSQENFSYNSLSNTYLGESNTTKSANVSNTTDLQEQYGTFSQLNEEGAPEYMQVKVPYGENSQTTGAKDIPEVVAEENPLNVDMRDFFQKSCPANENTETLKPGSQEMMQTETKLDDHLNNHESEASSSLLSDDVASLNNSTQPGNSKNDIEESPLAGSGSVMEQLRNTTSELTFSTDYQIPRKRTRKRVHKKKTKKIDASDTPPIFPKPKPVNIKGCPSIHIKFEDEENGNLGDELNETASVITANDKQRWKIKEEDVMKSQIMADVKPKVGDMIAFKVVRITESYTPELSTYIIGMVEEIENDEVLLNITSGLDQCVLPKGKLTIENEAEEVTTHQRFHWQSLLETRLLFP